MANPIMLKQGIEPLLPEHEIPDERHYLPSGLLGVLLVQLGLNGSWKRFATRGLIPIVLSIALLITSTIITDDEIKKSENDLRRETLQRSIVEIVAMTVIMILCVWHFVPYFQPPPNGALVDGRVVANGPPARFWNLSLSYLIPPDERKKLRKGNSGIAPIVGAPIIGSVVTVSTIFSLRENLKDEHQLIPICICRWIAMTILAFYAILFLAAFSLSVFILAIIVKKSSRHLLKDLSLAVEHKNVEKIQEHSAAIFRTLTDNVRYVCNELTKFSRFMWMFVSPLVLILALWCIKLSFDVGEGDVFGNLKDVFGSQHSKPVVDGISNLITLVISLIVLFYILSAMASVNAVAGSINGLFRDVLAGLVGVHNSSALSPNEKTSIGETMSSFRDLLPFMEMFSRIGIDVVGIVITPGIVRIVGMGLFSALNFGINAHKPSDAKCGSFSLYWNGTVLNTSFVK